MTHLLSDDSHALVLLCSSLALPPQPALNAPSPLTLSQWNQLSKKIAASPLQRPGALLNQSADALTAMLSLPGDEAERLAGLLGRAGRLALELEGLFSKGMWVMTRMDETYPAHLRSTLKHLAPVLVFGAGSQSLLQRPGLAVVGSRNIDEAGAAFARQVGRRAAEAKMPVVSGGARGTDRLAMEGALDGAGITFGVLADSLERTIRQPDLRQLLLDDRLVLVTPYAPTAGFSVGAAMGRNKIIYGLSKYAVVVSSEVETGGTWAGAVEALKGSWCPVFVRESPQAPEGNRALLKRGALPLTEENLAATDNLPEWLGQQVPGKPIEQDLFSG